MVGVPGNGNCTDYVVVHVPFEVGVLVTFCLVKKLWAVYLARVSGLFIIEYAHLSCSDLGFVLLLKLLQLLTVASLDVRLLCSFICFFGCWTP